MAEFVRRVSPVSHVVCLVDDDGVELEAFSPWRISIVSSRAEPFERRDQRSGRTGRSRESSETTDASSSPPSTSKSQSKPPPHLVSPFLVGAR